ncbi:diguanylate cyclase [Hydrogenovibrio sp. SC-1]|uniref:sensor domain-containing diguanylate cyclase n=1 Tax=Hydrogenovibrio sp. SC-1 TaxID=2065820 RepID=UPI000C7E6BF6|nr:diguanylate cyclase [Hydrogenovibrio sp. SC-1]PLA73451.1 diguanylate cyclase [Hydrogenovibrio sp. SC-1]
MRNPSCFSVYKFFLFIEILTILVFAERANAQAHTFDWQLYSIGDHQSFNPKQLESRKVLQKVDGISLVGGHYLYSGVLRIKEDGFYVVDFKNTSVIDQFSFYLYDHHNQLIERASGGIGSHESDPFFLRHGRNFYLKAGQYSLLAEVTSPYFIAQPVPYVSSLSQYQQAIKLGNAIVLIGIGIFLSMGIYYGALSFARSRNTEILYAVFIFSNLLFNAGAHQIFSQLFDWHNFYLISFPILISNFIYVLFVMKLLDVNPIKNKRLHKIGVMALVVIAVFALFGMLSPNWVNEMARYGVWVFLLYGLIAGVTLSLKGRIVARLYLIALMTFIGFASMATIPTQLSADTLYVEHFGLAAIAMEVILLALVMTYQVGELYRDRIKILLRLDHNMKLAQTDALTQIPNRYALDVELASPVDKSTSLTYIDMDNLKLYNDRYGHAKGDEMLSLFANLMKQGMQDHGCIYRVGGDEFAVTCPSEDSKGVKALIDKVVKQMRKSGFDDAGVSSGTAFMYEVHTISDLKNLADIRMYENKHQRKTKKMSV